MSKRTFLRIIILSICYLEFHSGFSKPLSCFKQLNGFIENKGQYDSKILIGINGFGWKGYITKNGLTFITKKNNGKKTTYFRNGLELVDAKIELEKTKKYSPKKFKTNYYTSYCKDGIQNVQTFDNIIIENIYPGIDWHIYFNENNLEYDFIIHPKADPKLIRLKYKGFKDNILTNKETIKHNTSTGYFEEKILKAYYGDEKNKKINCNYLKEEISYSFEIKKYDESRTIVIDPILIYGSFFTSINEFNAINSDGKNVWAVGSVDGTLPADFISYSNSYMQDTMNSNDIDLSISKLDTSGQLLWNTYYGGNNFEMATAIKSDGNNLWITGITASADLPIVKFNGGYNKYIDSASYFMNKEFNFDAFLLNFNCDNSKLIWSTYYGGVNHDYPCNSIACNGKNIIIGGYTASANLPVIKSDSGAYKQFYAGGRSDAFIASFSCLSKKLNWATFLGGSGGSVTDLQSDESIYSISMDDQHIWVAGTTESKDFPFKPFSGAHNQPLITNGSAFNTFVSEFSYPSDSLIWSTYYPTAGNILNNNKNNLFITNGSTTLQLNSNTNKLIRTINGGGSVISLDNENVWFAGSTGLINYTLLKKDSTGFFQDVYPNYDSTKNSAGYIQRFDTAGNLKWYTYFGSNSGTYPGILGAAGGHNYIDGTSCPVSLSADGKSLWVASLGEYCDQTTCKEYLKESYFNNPFATNEKYQPHTLPLLARLDESTPNKTKSNALDSLFEIYPIPTADWLYCKIPWSNEYVTLQLYDNVGKVIGNFSLHYPITTISTKSLGISEGLYEYIVLLNNTIYQKGKIIVE